MSSWNAFSQGSELKSLNNIINFSNECTHGMLIVHRLLENFNQEVNKFVDLESHQINFFSNKDLPKNIFEDPEKWFYEKSPSDWFVISLSQSNLDEKEWNDKMKTSLKAMYQLVTNINDIRFEAEGYINTNDLNDRTNQENIYVILEKGVRLFEDFYDEQKVLRKNIEDYLNFKKINIPTDPVRTIHGTILDLLEDLRYKTDDDWSSDITRLRQLLNQSPLQGEPRKKINAFLESATQFIETAEVIPEYKLYGKYYYYHNSRLLNFSNRYGNGYVNGYNEKLDPDQDIKLMEVPHFYKVIYPKKLLENVPLASSDPLIIDIPDRLKDRKISMSERVIYVDNDIVDLEIYDHKMIDGDIVSVNFNGDWILEDHPLKGKPYKINVKLNKEGKNFILLHAVNLGKQPPNTMALRYTYKGQRETVVLSSDLDESEVIEIRIKN